MAVTITAPTVTVVRGRGTIDLSWAVKKDSALVDAYAYNVYLNTEFPAKSGGVEVEVLDEDIALDGKYHAVIEDTYSAPIKGLIYLAVTALTLDGQTVVESAASTSITARLNMPSYPDAEDSIMISPTHALTMQKKLP